MAQIDFTALPPEEAIQFFRSKGYKIGFDYRDVWQEEHARAFTVAKAMTADLLEDIRRVTDQAISEGIAFEDFQKKLEPILRARGWWGRQEMVDPLTGKKRRVQLGSARRLAIIYDTNLRTSLAAGRWHQMQRTKKLRPYMRYVDPDPHPRPQHLAWSGTVLHKDDPWWATHYPPNGWNCKCYAEDLSEGDLRRYGYQQSAIAPPSPTRPYVNPRTGAVSEVPEGVDPAFASNPGMTAMQDAENALRDALGAAAPAVARAIEEMAEPAAGERGDAAGLDDDPDREDR